MYRIVWLLLLAGLQGVPGQPEGHTVQGYAAYYAPHVFGRVWARNFPHEDQPACLAAVPDLRQSDILAKRRYLSVRSTLRRERAPELVCRIADVASEQDRESIVSRGIVVELDYSSARVLCGLAEWARVKQDPNLDKPPSECPVVVQYLDY